MNKKTKILIAFMLVIVNISLLISSPKAVYANDNTYKGKVNLNLEDDTKDITSSLENALLQIDDFNLSTDYNLDLSGNIEYSNIILPIKLNGSLYKSEFAENQLTGDVIDESNNFEVINISIASAANLEDLFINDDLVDNEVISIYLMKMDTREFILFEIMLNELTQVNVNYNNAPELTDALNEQWWIKILTPETNIENSEEVTRTASNSISPYATHERSTNSFYQYTLSTDTSYIYYIKTTAKASVLDFAGSEQVTDTADFTVTDQYVTKNGTYLGDFADLIVCNPRVEVTITPLSGTSTTDWIQTANWSMNTTYKEGGLTFAFKDATFNTALGSFTWTPKTNIKYTNYNYSNTNRDVRGIQMSYPYAIQSIGENCNLSILKNKFNSTSTAKRRITFKFTYDIAYVNVKTIVTKNQITSVFVDYTN